MPFSLSNGKKGARNKKNADSADFELNKDLEFLHKHVAADRPGSSHSFSVGLII